MGNRWTEIECELARGDYGQKAVTLAPLVSYLSKKFPTLEPRVSRETFQAAKHHPFDGVEFFIFFEYSTPRRYRIGTSCGVALKTGDRKLLGKQQRWFRDETGCDQDQAYVIIDMYCKKLSHAEELIPVLIQYANDE